MWFLGIDPSLDGTGISIINNDYIIEISEKLHTKTHGVERLFHLENIFLSILNKYKDEIVLSAIESGSFHSEGRLFDMGEWSGILKLNLFKNNIPCIRIAPLQLKKYCSGKGDNFAKMLILLKTYQNFGVEFDDDNKCDAYILSRIARDYYHTILKKDEDISTLNLKEYQKNVLLKIYKLEERCHEKKLI